MASSNSEQLFLELINSARLDPLGDAARYIVSYSPLTGSQDNIQLALGPDGFSVVGATLLAQFTALTSAQPLAWNDNLAVAAREHDNAMIAADTQAHQLLGEEDLLGRAVENGYLDSEAEAHALGENIFAFTDDPLYGHAAFMVDWGDPGPGTTDGIQTPPGHRENIMNTAFREVGVGVVAESSEATDVGPLVVTQDFGNRAEIALQALILGVAYSDDVTNDDFYSIGEGVDGMTITIDGENNTTTTSSGGYVLAYAPPADGLTTITFAGGDLASDVTFQTDLDAGLNIKLDIVDGNTLQTSASGIVGGTSITTIRGLGLTGLTLTAGAGSQTLIGTKGNDTLSGGDGTDTVSYAAAAAAVTLNLSTGTATGMGTDSLTQIENAIGGASADVMTGNGAANVLTGGAGGDTLNGGNGNDTLKGGTGNDTLNGSNGTDAVSYSDATAAVIVNLTTHNATGGGGSDTLSSIENLIGSTRNDTLTGSNAANTLDGGNGNDKLNGGAGNDVLKGGTGSDTMTGGTGNDTYTVNATADKVTESSGQGTDIVQSSVTYTLGSNLEKLTLTGSGNVNGTGSSLSNTLTGNSHNNVLDGKSGNDVLDGKSGIDTLRGGDGDDTLIWSTADSFDGGGGNADTLKMIGNGDTIDLTTFSDARLKGIERIDLRTGQHDLTLNFNEVLNISSTSNELRILGDDQDNVHFGTGWTHGADRIIAGQSYETYTHGSATLLIDSDIFVNPS